MENGIPLCSRRTLEAGRQLRDPLPRQSRGDSGTPVRLRNAVAEILFGPTNPAALPGNTSTDVPAAPETLSNGSAYGNPSPSLFHASLPIQPAAADPAASVRP